MRPFSKSMGVMALILLATSSPLVAQTRYEAEAIGTPRNANDRTGYDSINGVVGRAADSAASNGELLFTLGPARNMKFIFRGTGVSLIGRQDGDGSGFTWKLNGGTPAEQTGTGTMFGASLVHQQAFPIAAQGSLPNALHTLEIGHDGGPGVLRVDAIDVFDNGVPAYVDESNSALVYSPGNWNPGETGADSAAEAFGGTTTWTTDANATVTVDFNGTGIAALVMVRGDSRTISWSINNGFRSGTVNLAAQNALSFGFWHRWPLLLANDLPAGNHTLVINSGPDTLLTNIFLDALVIDGDLGHLSSISDWSMYE